MTKDSLAVLLAAGFCVAVLSSVHAAEAPDPATEDFSSVATAVVNMLKSSHAMSFAEGLAPSLADWRTLVPTNQAASASDPITPEMKQSLASQRQQLGQSAMRVADTAYKLKMKFSKLQLTCKVVPPSKLASEHFPAQPEGETLPVAEFIDLVLTAEPLPNAPDAEALRGEYTLRLTDLVKFPDGWRCNGTLQWVAFPATIADETTRREVALQEKVAAGGELNGSDDPALQQLGENLATFLRKGDTKVFESEVAFTLEAMKVLIETMAKAGRQPPSEAELAEQWEKRHAKTLEPAKAIVNLMEQQGIDLRDAELKVRTVSLQRAASRFISGSLEGLIGSGLQVVVSATSTKNSKTGKSLSGDYILAADQAVRIQEHWYVLDELRLKEFPEGIVDEKTLATMQREAIIGESGYLPVGTVAPDIEFVRLSDGEKMKLADLRGQVVILDFWATWCGPCQEPMAKMQKYREENPEWKDRVTVMALSLDDSLNTVQEHMEKSGWTNTFNTWVGEGAWESAAPKSFRVRGVPTCYVIDAEGKIVQAGHPAAIHTPEVVNRLLK